MRTSSLRNMTSLTNTPNTDNTDSIHIDLSLSISHPYSVTSALDINKASGPDNISAFMLNTTAETHSSSVLKLYIAVVRPHLEYAAQVWKSHLAKDILSLERVQKFGLRICLRNYHTSYEYLLDFFKIPSLKNRRIFLSLCSFYLIKNHLVHFPSTGFLPPPMHHTSSRIYNPFGY